MLRMALTYTLDTMLNDETSQSSGHIHKVGSLACTGRAQRSPPTLGRTRLDRRSGHKRPPRRAAARRHRTISSAHCARVIPLYLRCPVVVLITCRTPASIRCGVTVGFPPFTGEPDFARRPPAALQALGIVLHAAFCASGSSASSRRGPLPAATARRRPLST